METQANDSYTLRFVLTEGEFRKAHRAHLRKSLFTTVNLFLVTIALLIGAVQTQLFGGAQWALRIFGLIWLAVVGLAVFVYVWMPSRIYRRNRGLNGEQCLRFDPSGVEWSMFGMTKRLGWSDVAKATAHLDFIYIHPRQGLPWILPKRVFSSQEELYAFDAYVGKSLLERD